MCSNITVTFPTVLLLTVYSTLFNLYNHLDKVDVIRMPFKLDILITVSRGERNSSPHFKMYSMVPKLTGAGPVLPAIFLNLYDNL